MANRGIGSTASLLSGMAIGALAMYILDPERGGQRRALARDKLVHAGRVLGREGRKHAANLGNHVRGAIEEQKAKIRDRERQVDDQTLHDRVRAQLGHVVSHPGALEVEVLDGCVIVRGPVLRGEGEKVRDRLEVTRGVRSFDCRLEEHESAADVPALQGQSRSQWRTRVG